MRRGRVKPHETAALKKAFLAAYAELGTITHACKAAGIDRSSYQTWAREDGEFVAAIAAANDQYVDSLEREVHRRAVEGTRRYKFHGGKPIIDPETVKGGRRFDPQFPDGQPYYEDERSDTLIIFRLKAERPQKYRDNVDVTSAGKALRPTVVKVLKGVSMDDL